LDIVEKVLLLLLLLIISHAYGVMCWLVENVLDTYYVQIRKALKPFEK